jgi:hypothetical protein
MLGENLTGLFNGTSPLSLHLPDLGAYTAPKVAIDVIGITYYDELIKFNIVYYSQELWIHTANVC